MSEIATVLEQLQRERNRLTAELRQLDQAIRALAKVGGKAGAKSRTRHATRSMSVAARNRIAAAQRARWAKFRASKRGKTKAA
jgi:hypothetical protein